MTREELLEAGYEIHMRDDGTEVATHLETLDQVILTPAKGSKKQKATKEKVTDYMVSRTVVDAYPHPLAYRAGRFFTLTDQGWINCDNHILSLMNRLRQRETSATCYKIAVTKLRINDDISTSATYFHRDCPSGQQWEGDWITLDPSRDEVVFADRIVNLKTGQTRDMSGLNLFGPVITLPYDPAAINQEWLDLVAHAFPDPDLRRHFQEVMGTVLQPHAHTRCHIILWGEPHTGKTTLATAIACAPGGHRAASFVSEDYLARSTWGAAALVDKFANVSNDSDLTPRWEGFMKRYTSGVLTVEIKYRQPEDVKVSAKLLSTCNELQPYNDASGASAMRMIPFHLTHELPALAYPYGAEKMTPQYWSDPTRRAGVLSWMIEGLQRLISRGHFLTPEVYKQDKHQATRRAAPLADTLRTLFRSAPDQFVTCSEAYAQLGDEANPAAIRKAMEHLFPQCVKKQKRINGERVWCFYNVELVEVDE